MEPILFILFPIKSYWRERLEEKYMTAMSDSRNITDQSHWILATEQSGMQSPPFEPFFLSSSLFLSLFEIRSTGGESGWREAEPKRKIKHNERELRAWWWGWWWKWMGVWKREAKQTAFGFLFALFSHFDVKASQIKASRKKKSSLSPCLSDWLTWHEWQVVSLLTWMRDSFHRKGSSNVSQTAGSCCCYYYFLLLLVLSVVVHRPPLSQSNACRTTCQSVMLTGQPALISSKNSAKSGTSKSKARERAKFQVRERWGEERESLSMIDRQAWEKFCSPWLQPHFSHPLFLRLWGSGVSLSFHHTLCVCVLCVCVCGVRELLSTEIEPKYSHLWTTFSRYSLSLLFSDLPGKGSTFDASHKKKTYRPSPMSACRSHKQHVIAWLSNQPNGCLYCLTPHQKRKVLSCLVSLLFERWRGGDQWSVKAVPLLLLFGCMDLLKFLTCVCSHSPHEAYWGSELEETREREKDVFRGMHFPISFASPLTHSLFFFHFSSHLWSPKIPSWKTRTLPNADSSSSPSLIPFSSLFSSNVHRSLFFLAFDPSFKKSLRHSLTDRQLEMEA